jgi:hypothetical protein
LASGRIALRDHQDGSIADAHLGEKAGIVYPLTTKGSTETDDADPD